MLSDSVANHRVTKNDILTGLIWDAIEKQRIGDESVKIEVMGMMQTTLRLHPYIADRFNELRAKKKLSLSKAISLILVSSDKIYLDKENYVIEFKNYPDIKSQ